MKLLEPSNMQIDLRFEVLSMTFMESIKKTCPKILHLSPPLLQVDGNDSLLVENDQLESYNLDIKSIEAIEHLDIYLIIIEMTDCHRICEAFKRLGVAHVISFSATPMIPSSDESSSDDNAKAKKENTEFEGDKLRKYQAAMKDFCLCLYPLLVEDGREIADAVKVA